MKIYFKSRHGREFRLESNPREPMDSGKFYALVCLAAGALFVALLLGISAIKHLWG